ncbi:AraC family transcriptional regulator [Paenibacillus spongiae]|uniref:AraC family transcriptional regulator n=1 Tax=Paenibacillus spongiae TaxID=2909671 RepID=A0ABY5S0H6_9BACL|nr:AraC family transcriptional regulator [Paenibacillus spongiae]UVI27331.1 AraC family transcriptional regulator [Paenibacillus spongiae]
MKIVKLSIEQPVMFASAGSFTADRQWIHQQRTNNSFEIMIGIRDAVYMDIDGGKYVMRPKQTLIIPPNSSHRGYAYSDKNCSFHWLHFYCQTDYSLLDEKEFQADLHRLNANPYFNELGAYAYIQLHSSPPEMERIHILFHQLLHIMESRYTTRHGMDYAVTSLLIELSEQTMADYNALGGNEALLDTADKKLNKMLEWIRIHSDKNISVQDVALEFKYNKDYLTRLFKLKTGMNMQEYIHRLKVSKAKAMLYQTSLSIKEIAYALGFQDEKYFMKLFKKHENLTPSEYRSAYYRTHMNIR